MTPPSIAPAAPGRWRVGTLEYTMGGLVALFAWLLWGDFAWALKERAIPAIVQLLLKRFEASDLLAGIFIGSIPQVFWIFLGPVISYRSDRHRGRFGRRIPYLVLTTPFAVLGMFGLAASPWLGAATHAWLGAHSPGLNILSIGWCGVFWTVFEIATVAANSVFLALINDVVPARLIGRFFGLFRAFGLLAGVLFNYHLLGQAETHFFELFVAIGLVYGVGLLLMSWRVKEGRYQEPPPVPSGAGWRGATRTYLRECFSERNYLWLYGGIAFAYMALVSVNLFSVFFAKSLGVPLDTYGKYLALTYVISFTLSYALGALADRVHPLRAGLAVMGLHLVVCGLSGLLIRSPQSFAVAFVSQAVCAGAFLTVTASLPQRMLPKESFAQFNSALEIVKNLGIMAVGPLVGWLLDAVGSQYRYAFLAAAGFSGLAVVCFGVVYSRRFRLAPDQQDVSRA